LLEATVFLAGASVFTAIAVLDAFSPRQDAAVAVEHLPSDMALAHSVLLIVAQAVLSAVAQQAFLAGVALVVDADACALAANENAAKAAIRNNFFILNLVLNNLNKMDLLKIHSLEFQN
jgi:hypothetical protein